MECLGRGSDLEVHGHFFGGCSLTLVLHGTDARAVIRKIHWRAQFGWVTRLAAPGDIHGAARPESTSQSPERVPEGDDQWTRADSCSGGNGLGIPGRGSRVDGPGL